ncbi:hypothetical protein P3342_003103 [Pyrenophora teres f. teres]|uniref:Uncharacterized protein n=1 Tax=Pyrenophora teres f. teres TaxID=97479 RepID=A0A6S6VJ15_9PLEO|nr:hypothetical protein P3342_003103 [Pyrenophora teres f. teres]CAE7009851.1 hypothetical protein PTTW11_01911 [Pyrenophora teres f. teres]
MSDPNDRMSSQQDCSRQLNYINDSSRKVLSFQNPNSRRYAVHDENGDATGTEWEWWSRENRKGRHILLLNHDRAPSHAARTTYLIRALIRIVTVIAWWDVSWWIGVLFSFGSMCSITSGVLQWLPIAYPSMKFVTDPSIVAGVVAFIRGIVFLVGGVLLVVEAVNANQSDCFGWALKEALNSDQENIKLSSRDEEKDIGSDFQTWATTSGFQPDRRHCTHIYNPDRVKYEIMHTKNFKVEARPTLESAQTWKWWPTWQDVRVHYRREIGFNANLILFIGTAIFWVTNLLTLPGIYQRLPQGVMYGLYYPSFLLGAISFLLSSILYILEVQRQWWKPAPHMVGWWVGMTNLVGSVGWIWSACLGYCDGNWCQYQSVLALVWAPAIYLVGSLLLVYEAVEKWPVHVDG